MKLLKCEYCGTHLGESECILMWVDYGRVIFRTVAEGPLRGMPEDPYVLCASCTREPVGFNCDFCESDLDEGEGYAMWADNGQLCFREMAEEPSETVPDRPYLICEQCRQSASLLEKGGYVPHSALFEDVRSGDHLSVRGGLMYCGLTPVSVGHQ